MKLIDLERYHVFQFDGDTKIYLLNENYHNLFTGKCQFEWHRIYNDGRTNMRGIASFDALWLENTEVTDLGDFYDWMKANHPKRYFKEGWELSRPKKKGE